MLNRLLSILNKQKLKETINIIPEILGITQSLTLLTIRYQILGSMKTSLPPKSIIRTQRKELESLQLRLNPREILCYLILNIITMILHTQLTIQQQILVLIKTSLIHKNILKTWKRNMVNGLLLRWTQNLNQTPNQTLTQNQIKNNLLFKLMLKENLSYLKYSLQNKVQVIQLTIQSLISELTQIFKKLMQAEKQLKKDQVRNLINQLKQKNLGTTSLRNMILNKPAMNHSSGRMQSLHKPMNK